MQIKFRFGDLYMLCPYPPLVPTNIPDGYLMIRHLFDNVVCKVESKTTKYLHDSKLSLVSTVQAIDPNIIDIYQCYH